MSVNHWENPDGRDIIFVVNKDGKELQYTYRNGNFYHDGKRYNPGKESISKTMYRVLSVYRKIESSNDKDLKGILHHLENPDSADLQSVPALIKSKNYIF